MNEPATILTLISQSEPNLLTDEFINSLLFKIDIIGETKWLSRDEAADITLASGTIHSHHELKQNVKQAIAQFPIDFALQTSNYRQKKLLIADMDSTIIGQECIDEIADMAGIKDQVSAITERAMQGELDFEEALRARVKLLKGLDASALNTVIKDHLSINKGAKTLVRTMAEKGALCALVSGGFTFFTNQIAEQVGFHVNQANTLEIENNQLTGAVIEPILGRAAKKQALNTFTKQQNLIPQQTLAIGDGANDLDMIKTAGLGIAYYAKPIVAIEADAAINHSDLTAALFMQGISKHEFTS